VLGIPPAFILSQDQTLHDEQNPSILVDFSLFFLSTIPVEKSIVKICYHLSNYFFGGGVLLILIQKTLCLKNRQTIVLSRFCAFVGELSLSTAHLPI
jgi:hypothetical protein